MNSTNLLRFLESVKDEVLVMYKTSGAVILRGFPFEEQYKLAEHAFHLLTDHRPGGGPLGWLPGWTQNVLKDSVLWIMMRLIDGRREGGMRALAPSSRNVQGPHQESSFLTWRMPTVGFFCEIPPVNYGETAFYDASAAYKALPDNLKAKLKQYDYYYDLHAGILYDTLPRFIYDIVARVSFFCFNQPQGWVPLLLRSPVSGETCLQWFGFGKRINEQAANAFNKFYPNRGAVACNDYFGEYFIKPRDDLEREGKDLLPIAPDGKHFTTEDEVAIAEVFFARSSLIAWQKNDLALVDNIRWAHGRVNGGPPRMLHFFQAQPMIKIDETLAVRE